MSFNDELLAKKLKEVSAYEVDTTIYEVKLDANESFLPLSCEILSDFQNLIKKFEYNRYPDSLAEKLVKAFSSFYHLDYSYVIAGNGSDELISLIMNCFLEKEDKVLTFNPDFSMYAFYAKLSELEVIIEKKRSDFSIDFESLQNQLSNNLIKLVIFSNPCNPTGKIEEKEKIKKVIIDNPNTIFIIDEAYMDFCCGSDDEYKYKSFLRETSNYPNVIVLKTLSKAFGCAALRIGFAIGDKISAKAFQKAKSPYNVNSISQDFGEILFNHPQFFKDSLKKINDATVYLRKVLLKHFPPEQVLETETNFVVIKNKYAKQIWNELKNKSILVRFIPFEEDFLRITSGNKEEIEKLDKALESILKEKTFSFPS